MHFAVYCSVMFMQCLRVGQMADFGDKTSSWRPQKLVFKHEKLYPVEQLEYPAGTPWVTGGYSVIFFFSCRLAV